MFVFYVISAAKSLSKFHSQGCVRRNVDSCLSEIKNETNGYNVVRVRKDRCRFETDRHHVPTLFFDESII